MCRRSTYGIPKGHIGPTLLERELATDPEMEPIIDESVGFYEPEPGAEAARSLYRNPTINLGILEGGTAINTVPASACARVDIRLSAGVDTGDVLRLILACLADMDGIELTDLSWTSGTYEPLGTPLVEGSSNAAEHVVDDRVYCRSATAGFPTRFRPSSGNIFASEYPGKSFIYPC